MLLATARLRLREAEPDDPVALEAYQADARYLEHYAQPPKSASELIQLARQWATESPRLNYQLIITLGTRGTVIGCGGLRQAGYPPGEAEIGIELNPDHWGHGYAGEVLLALIRFARDELQLGHLYALTTPTNLSAQRLVRRLGFLPAPPHGEGFRFQLPLAGA